MRCYKQLTLYERLNFLYKDTKFKDSLVLTFGIAGKKEIVD
jgi:hypothetical protein